MGRPIPSTTEEKSFSELQASVSIQRSVFEKLPILDLDAFHPGMRFTYQYIDIYSEKFAIRT